MDLGGESEMIEGAEIMRVGKASLGCLRHCLETSMEPGSLAIGPGWGLIRGSGRRRADFPFLIRPMYGWPTTQTEGRISHHKRV